MEPLVCQWCGAVYTSGRWMAPHDPRVVLSGDRVATKTVCSACRGYEAGAEGSGYLQVEGRFYVGHRDEVERLLEAEASRASKDNPLARVTEWDRSLPDALLLTTATGGLAERMAQGLREAFGGAADSRFSQGNEGARVRWMRD